MTDRKYDELSLFVLIPNQLNKFFIVFFQETLHAKSLMMFQLQNQ